LRYWKSARQTSRCITWLPIKLSRQQKAVAKNELIEESGAGESSIRSLIEKEVFFAEHKTISRLGYEEDDEAISNFVLSEAQQLALAEVRQHFEKKDVVLLHGVTASGKTQIYIKLIEEMMPPAGRCFICCPR
jgi:primosomal protein N' (replication factor Y)